MAIEGHEALQHKVKNALDEARILVLGVQVLLGFQYRAFMEPGFDKLPPALRALHFVSLCFIAATTALLMSIAAWHRIAERGHDSERLERVAGAMVLGAMALLACGLSLEVTVVAMKWSGALGLSAALGGGVLLGLAGLWFGFTLLLRGRKPEAAGQHAH